MCVDCKSSTLRQKTTAVCTGGPPPRAAYLCMQFNLFHVLFCFKKRLQKKIDVVHLPCLGTQDLKFTNLNHAKLEKAFYKKNQHTSLGNSV